MIDPDFGLLPRRPTMDRRLSHGVPRVRHVPSGYAGRVLAHAQGEDGVLWLYVSKTGGFSADPLGDPAIGWWFPEADLTWVSKSTPAAAHGA